MKSRSARYFARSGVPTRQVCPRLRFCLTFPESRRNRWGGVREKGDNASLYTRRTPGFHSASRWIARDNSSSFRDVVRLLLFLRETTRVQAPVEAGSRQGVRQRETRSSQSLYSCRY